MSLYQLKYLAGVGAIMATLTSAIADTQTAQNDTPDYNKKMLERVMVIGSQERADNIAGSATFIDKEELEKFNHTDIHRVLRQVPGVNIQEEEGFGNRPNIGIRGGRSERSADITLMEDGVLIAPAPYASPSAYYFPRVGRMEGIEVRKGSSTIKSGPRTTSGVVNLLSSSVPESEEFDVSVGAGMFGILRGDMHYGNKINNFGFVLDLGHESTDGFKDLDNGGDTGYSIQDVMAKFKLESGDHTKYYQSFEFKIGATEEDSDETYLGLSQADFEADPFRRYAGSQRDNMDASHQNYMLRHFIDFNNFDVTTTLYHNDFERNWYKSQDVTVGGTTYSVASALNDPAALAALRGEVNLDGSSTDNIQLRANNRRYFSQGVQTDIGTEFNTGNLKHNLEIGARFHRDEESRLQWEDDYAINNGVMTLVTSRPPGSQANRDSTATAYAAYIYDEIDYGHWTFAPGLRYEHIQLKRHNIGGSITNNTVDAFMPGMSAAYKITDGSSVFGGVHRGFAPPAPGSTSAEAEESINYELGFRHTGDNLRAEMVGFYVDYDNLLGDCTASSGCFSGSIGDQFNGGEVETYGIEASLSSDLAPSFGWYETSLPVGVTYTYTQAEFQNNFTSNFDEWGTVSAGDALPYIPEHQFYIHAGIVQTQWQAHIGGKFVDEMRTSAGSGTIPYGEGTDAHFVVDLSGDVALTDRMRAFVNVNNVFDEEYVAARRPAGARPGMPLTVFGGLRFSLN